MRSVLLRGVFTSHAERQAPGRAAWGSPFDADESFLSRGGAVAQDVVTYARLVWAAHLSESPALTIGDIADRLEASSPHSFGRTVRLVLALTPTDFRRRYNGSAMLERFRDQLIAPYRDKLRTLDPVGDAGAAGSRQYGREGG